MSTLQGSGLTQQGTLFEDLCDHLSLSEGDFSILHTFAAQPFPAAGVRPYTLIDFDIEALLRRTSRWLVPPSKREYGERAASRRLGNDNRSLKRTDGRFFTAMLADYFWENRKSEVLKSEAPLSPPPEPQDVRWATQQIAGDGTFDPFLYRLYAKNLDVFGDKASRDLYTFSVLESKGRPVIYKIDEIEIAPGLHYALPTCELDKPASLKLRLFLVGKQLANQNVGTKGKVEDVSFPPQGTPGLLFAPVVAIAGVLSPDDSNPPGKENVRARFSRMLSLAIAFEAARFKRRACDAEWLNLGDLLLGFINESVGDENSQLNGMRPTSRPFFDSKVSEEWRFKNLQLTQVTTFAFGLRDDSIQQCLISDKPRPGQLEVPRTSMLHLIASLCDPRFRISARLERLFPDSFDGFRCRDTSEYSLAELVRDYFPHGSSVQVTSNTLSIVSPGRKVLLRSLPHRSLAVSNPQKGYDYNWDDLLESCAWNLLLSSLIVIQEAQLQGYHAELSDSQNIKRVREALSDFDDLFDVSLFDLPAAALYRDSFEQMKLSAGVDRQYAALDKKLEILQEAREVDSLSQAVKNVRLANITICFAIFTFVASFAIQLLDFFDMKKVKDLAAGSADAIASTLLAEGKKQQAFEVFSIAVNLDPGDGLAHGRLGDMYCNEHNVTHALNEYIAAVSNGHREFQHRRDRVATLCDKK